MRCGADHSRHSQNGGFSVDATQRNGIDFCKVLIAQFVSWYVTFVFARIVSFLFSILMISLPYFVFQCVLLGCHCSIVVLCVLSRIVCAFAVYESCKETEIHNSGRHVKTSTQETHKSQMKQFIETIICDSFTTFFELSWQCCASVN